MTPKFQPEPVELRKVGTASMLPLPVACEACGEEALRDVATKLCRDCWRCLVLGAISGGQSVYGTVERWKLGRLP